jgi:hypothetical protein
MKKHRLIIGFLILSTGMSCAEETSTDENPTSSSSGMEGYGPYPNVINYDKHEDEKQEPWVCGYEFIESIGPQGEIFLIEVQIPCDPSADIYKGCPQPNIKNKKAP